MNNRSGCAYGEQFRSRCAESSGFNGRIEKFGFTEFVFWPMTYDMDEAAP